MLWLYDGQSAASGPALMYTFLSLQIFPCWRKHEACQASVSIGCRAPSLSLSHCWPGPTVADNLLPFSDPPSLSSWHEKCLELFHSQFSHCNLCLPPSLTMQSKANNRPSLALGVVMERHWTQLQCQTKDKSWPVKRCQRSRNPVDLMYTSTRLCIIGFELSYTCLLHPGVIHCLGYRQMFQNKNRKITWDVHSWCHGTQKQNGLPSVLEKLWVMMGWARFLFFFFFFSGTLCECCMFFSFPVIAVTTQSEWSMKPPVSLSLSVYPVGFWHMD